MCIAGARHHIRVRPVLRIEERKPIATAGLALATSPSCIRNVAFCIIDGEAAAPTTIEAGGREGYNVHFDDRCTAEISVAPLGPGEK